MSIYQTTYDQVKQILWSKYGNVANCLQARGDLQEINNEILKVEPVATGEIGAGRLDALYSMQDYLLKWIDNNCNEDGSTSVDTPPVTQYPGTGGQLPIDETPEPTPTEGGNNSLIWIAGAALIGFIIYTNNKKGYKRRSKPKRRK
jgi:hypothetical protein